MSAETIWVASGMGVAIVAMAIYITKLHKYSSTTMKDALIKNAESNNNLANAINTFKIRNGKK